jgi:hypothetical protein
MKLETVKIVSPVSQDNPHGYIVINKSDVTPLHKIFVEPVAAKPVPKAAARRDVFVDGKE